MVPLNKIQCNRSHKKSSYYVTTPTCFGTKGPFSGIFKLPEDGTLVPKHVGVGT